MKAASRKRRKSRWRWKTRMNVQSSLYQSVRWHGYEASSIGAKNLRPQKTKEMPSKLGKIVMYIHRRRQGERVQTELAWAVCSQQ
jgi:hypothetical protein